MTASKFRMMSAQESGVGGFLLLFTIVMVINLLVLLVRMPGHWFAVTDESTATLGRLLPEYPYVLMGEFIFALARVVGIVIGLVLIVRRDQRAPAFFMGFLGGVIVLTLVDMYFGSRLSDVVHAAFTQHGQSTAAYDEAHRKARYQNIGSLLWTAAWLLYWRSSERVRLTFTPGSGGMAEIPTQS
jgi:hypothetical protein